MSLLSRLFAIRADPSEPRALWHRIVAIAREPQWYLKGGIADTVEGRFDAVVLVLSLVLFRLEREPALTQVPARLTELFVSDMDGQLRESGVGDLMVGKKVGQLMSVLGGRLGAYRAALAGEPSELGEAVSRNVSLNADSSPEAVAALMRQLAAQLDTMPIDALLAGRIER